MGKEILTFANIEKNKFYRNKTPIFLKDVGIEKILVCNKISFGKKTINTLLVTCIIILKLMFKICSKEMIYTTREFFLLVVVYLVFICLFVYSNSTFSTKNGFF